MVRTEQLGETALTGDALELRSLVQEWLAENPCLEKSAAPDSDDSTVLAITAGIIETLAQRMNQGAPSWSAKIGSAPRSIFLLKSISSMPRLRVLCETESPLPLRRRNVLVPPTFLEFA